MSDGQASDANLLTALFGQAYQAFCDARGPLVREAPAPALSAARAHEAAREMQAALRQIVDGLRRDAHLRIAPDAPDQGADLRLLLYCFVAMVDEVLLSSAWPGASQWEPFLLEASYFKARQAGSRLLRMAADLVAKPRSRATLDMGGLLLACLNLGFQGDLRGRPDGPATLAQLRSALFAYVYPHQERITQAGFRLSEPAALHVIRTAPGQRRLARQVRWYALPLAALLLYGAASTALWLHQRQPLTRILDNVKLAP